MESITIDVLMDLMSKVIDDKVDTITSKQYGEYFLDSMENVSIVININYLIITKLIYSFYFVYFSGWTL